MAGIEVEFTQESERRYSLELQSSDFVGNMSEVLEYNLEVPAEIVGVPVANQYVSTLDFTGLTSLFTGRDKEFPGWLIVEWDAVGAAGATLQQTDNLTGEWVDVSADLIDSEDNVDFYWTELTAVAQFFRLIKR